METFYEYTSENHIIAKTVASVTLFRQQSEPKYRHIIDVMKLVIAALPPKYHEEFATKLNKILYDAMYVPPENFSNVWDRLTVVITQIMDGIADIGIQTEISKIMRGD